MKNSESEDVVQIAKVVLPIPLNQLFDYQIPQGMSVAVGARVVVPFGNKKSAVAIVFALSDETTLADAQLKMIEQVLDKDSLFQFSSWQLLTWASHYYQHPLGEVLFQALPIKLRQGGSSVAETEWFYRLTEQGKQVLSQSAVKVTAKQKEALLHLQQNEKWSKSTALFSSSIKKTLLEKGWIALYQEEHDFPQWQNESPIHIQNRLTLNKQQALAVNRIVFTQGFVAWLLYGVTGSGKTEVYLQVIEEVLKKGQQVLVLVPEIGLTPQTIRRFQARFNVPIDVLHSNLNDTQRLLVWQRAKNESSAIVIGTRSALFTQFAHLGLIILDEEHDPSFKQQEGWRYHTRDLAVYYAKLLNIPIILGSATPSLESFANSQHKKYQLLPLTQRALTDQHLNYQVIDLKNQPLQSGLSVQLLHKMEKHLKQGNQVLLFLNRRGFSPLLLCHECGWIASCMHCDKPYTYHQNRHILRCHHCATQKKLPHQCPSCGSTHLITSGVGTEQLEQFLSQHFAGYQTVRLDRDSTTRKGELEAKLNAIAQGKYQILIGTQMLTKGHHFPNVTLVALINVDNALFSMDFRAEERLAQQFIQVAGRAGRANKQGEVLLQTHYPNHTLIHTLLQQDYSAYLQQALQQRKIMGLPPYSYQTLFAARSKYSEAAEQFLQQIFLKLTALCQQNPQLSCQIIPPMPALNAKKAGLYRWQLLLQHQSRQQREQLLTLFAPMWKTLRNQQNVRCIIDVDPYDFG